MSNATIRAYQKWLKHKRENLSHRGTTTGAVRHNLKEVTMKRIEVQRGDVLVTPAGDFLYEGQGIFTEQPKLRTIKTRLFLDNSDQVRCWTSDWARSEAEVAGGYDFKVWLETHPRSQIVKMPQR